MAETDCIQISLSNGETETIMLSSRPKLIFDSLQISVIYDGKTISIPLEDGLKVRHMDSSQTDVEGISSQGIYFSISDDGISCHGLSCDESVNLFSGNGTLLQTVKSDAFGNASINLPETFWRNLTKSASISFCQTALRRNRLQSQSPHSSGTLCQSAA